METIEILKLAYKMELDGQDFYREKKDKVSTSLLQKTFDYLSNMEKEHAEYIKEQIDNINNNKPIEDLPDMEEDKYEKIFSEEKAQTSDIDSSYGDYSILRMAYLIEKDFVNYYERAAQQEKDSKAKEIFEKLTEWEKGHAKIMKDNLQMIIQKDAFEEKFFEPLY